MTHTLDPQVTHLPTTREATSDTSRERTANGRSRWPSGAETLAAPELWTSVSRGRLQQILRPVVRRMIHDILHEIRRNVPAYAKPLAGKFGAVLVTGVERAVLQIIDNLDQPRTDTAEWEKWFRYTGRLEFEEGRSMDALQAAVRIGAKVAWRHTRAAGVAAGLPSKTLFAIADAIFAYTDELCMVAISGYTEAQSRASGSVERRRQQLLRMLISDKPVTRDMIAEVAASTDWVVPDRVAVVVLEHRSGQVPSATFDRGVLIDMESPEPMLVVSDPDSQLAPLCEVAQGRKAAVGPLVPLHQAHNSLTRARRALALAQRNLLPGNDIVRCTDHLSTLTLLSDEFLVSQIARRALEPFDTLTPKQRERLTTTLQCWLGIRGGINEIAAALDVHPQTVRYRMNQISDILGDRLDDPEERLMLHIALRANELLGRQGKAAS